MAQPPKAFYEHGKAKEDAYRKQNGLLMDAREFNEYFTDKIAVDIFNYLIEIGCPLLKGEEKLERNFSNSGPYYAPDVFLKHFYDKYKKEICVCKLNNSDEI